MIINDKEFFVCDTEDNSKGGLYHINFYNGRKHWSFTTVEQSLEFMRTYEEKVLCFCVNLEYDIINIFRGYYDKLRWNFAKSRIVSAKYKKFLFYDTYNHWKKSVAGMGEYLGKKKLPFNPTSLKYCRRDCVVTFEFVKKMLGLYGKIGFEVKSTLPSTVYDYWFREYCLSKGRKRIENKTLDTYKKAYYGGRCDCFYIGKMRGTIQTADINSLYPSVMREPYPYPYQAEKRYSLYEFGVSDVLIRCNQDIPVLPYRTKTNKLIYPNGEFRGWWCNDELRYAISCGDFKIARVYNSYTFPITCFPFDKFITSFYKRRRATKDELLNMLYKISMNSLYGKFGQGKGRTMIMSLAEYVRTKGKSCADVVTQFGNLVIYTVNKDYPVNTNMIWALYTTAYARIALHKHLTAVKKKGGMLLYCDTDSVFYASKDNLLPIGDKLGQFKNEGVYKSIEIKAPKMYKLDTKTRINIKTKGIPKAQQATYFKTGIAKYKKPLKFKEALRRKAVPNMWIDYTKRNQFIYDKGVISKNGIVKPHKLSLDNAL